jgi:hypothetical protein
MRHGVLLAGLAGLAGAGAIAGCGGSGSGLRDDKEFAARASREVDLLFLVDDSASMTDKQAHLATSFGPFVASLGEIAGGLPSLHVGVVTSDMGTKGFDDAAPGPPVGPAGNSGCMGLGKDGALQLFGAPVTGGRFLSDVVGPSGERVRNYTGELSDAFAKIATGAGAKGCGFEQPLAAIRRALDPANTANQGFLRPDAYLGVVIISDEDDCSLSHSAMLGPEDPVLGPLQSFRCTRFGIQCDQGGKTPADWNQLGPKDACHPSDGSGYLTPIDDFVHFLEGLKPDPSMVFVSGLIGPPHPVGTELRTPINGTMMLPALARSCSYQGDDRNGDGVPDVEVADPAIRLAAFIDQFGDRGSLVPICQPLNFGLTPLRELVANAIGDRCLAGELVDRDGAAPGLQADCTATAISQRGQPGEAKTALPRCDDGAGNAPCWRIAADPAQCPDGEHRSLAIEGAELLPAGARIEASCERVR